jgi:hypothetical protein
MRPGRHHIALRLLLVISVFAALLLRIPHAFSQLPHWMVTECTGPAYSGPWGMGPDTRNQWIYVADDSSPGWPPIGCHPFPGTQSEATQAAAAALADTLILKSSPGTATDRFMEVCKHSWSVWEYNYPPHPRTVIDGPIGPNFYTRIAGSPYPTGLCCPNAYNLAGIPPGDDCRAYHLLSKPGVVVYQAPNGTWQSLGGGPIPSIGAPLRLACSGTFYSADGGVTHLTRSGSVVTGTYTGGRGHTGLTGTINGTVSGNTVTAQFTNHEGSITGSGTMTFVCGADGTISGSYRSSDGRQSGQMAWTVTPPSAPQPNAQGIHVLSGIYGGNCPSPHRPYPNNPSNTTDKTQYLTSACEGKDRCEYTINWEAIGDPAYGCKKDYVARWQCIGKAGGGTVRAEPEAGRGSKILLICG